MSIFDRILSRDLYLRNIKLMKTFEEITDLCDDLFANGHIKTMTDAIINFYKYMDDIEFNFFDYGETRDLMDTILIKLENYDKELDSVLDTLPFVMDKPIASKHIIRQDFLYQLAYR